MNAKKLFLVILAVLVAFSISACTSNKSTNEPTGQEESIKQEEPLKQEEPIPETGDRKIKLDQSFKVADCMEFTFTDSEWADTVTPSKTEGQYRYLTDTEGEKYFVIRGKISNLSDEELNMKYIVPEVELVINNEYTYVGQVIAEDKNGDIPMFVNMGTYVSPQSEQNIIVIVSVMDEAFDSAKNAKIKMNMLNDISKMRGSISDATYDEITMEFDM